jgi:hypothetical protein
MEVAFEYVPDIPPQISGKYQMVVHAMTSSREVRS